MTSVHEQEGELEDADLADALLEIEEEDWKEQGYNQENGYFGVPLDHEAPIPLCDAFAFLRKNGMREQGLFRSPGNLARVRELEREYNKEFHSPEAKTLETYSVINESPEPVKPADAASLIKSYFSQLPKSLVPATQAEEMRKTVQTPSLSKERKTLMIQAIYSRMPSPEKECMGLFMLFLRDLLKEEEHTKMNASNIGMCNAVCLFKANDPISQLKWTQVGTQVIKLILESEDFVLSLPDEKLVERNTKYREDYVKRKEFTKERKASSFLLETFKSSSLVRGFFGKKSSNRNLRSVLTEEQEAQQKSPNSKKQKNRKRSEGSVSAESGFGLRGPGAAGASVKNKTKTNANDQQTGKNEVPNMEKQKSKVAKKKETKLMRQQRKQLKKQNKKLNGKSVDKVNININGVKATETLKEVKAKNHNHDAPSVAFAMAKEQQQLAPSPSQNTAPRSASTVSSMEANQLPSSPKAESKGSQEVDSLLSLQKPIDANEEVAVKNDTINPHKARKNVKDMSHDQKPGFASGTTSAPPLPPKQKSSFVTEEVDV